jgi:hypothetical protein
VCPAFRVREEFPIFGDGVEIECLRVDCCSIFSGLLRKRGREVDLGPADSAIRIGRGSPVFATLLGVLGKRSVSAFGKVDIFDTGDWKTY